MPVFETNDPLGEWVRKVRHQKGTGRMQKERDCKRFRKQMRDEDEKSPQFETPEVDKYNKGTDE